MFNVQLERIRNLSHSTRDFRFSRTDGAAVAYQPGQFFRFVFEDDDGEFERSYSLCNFEPAGADQLDLVISRVEGGRATRLLFSDGIDGLTARVTGPFGRLVLPGSDPARLVLVATSVGLAPYMPILRELETRELDEVVLLLGVRDRTEFIYGDLLRQYEKKHANFTLRLSLSREAPDGPGEFSGYVNEQIVALKPDPETDHFLLCGNPMMIDDAWDYLKSRGLGARQVIREKYVFAKEKKAARAMTEEQKRLIAEKMKKFSS